MEKTDKQIIRVSIVGPECTGKSTLSSLLAKYYDTIWVKEYARHYIDRLERNYEEKDLLEIAKGQIRDEDQLAEKANRVLICDTDLMVIKVWAEHKYGAAYQEILDEYQRRNYDLYILTGTDIPWEEDPQRENPALRNFFYNTFKTELEAREAHYIEVSGNHYERQKKAVNAIDDLLKYRQL